MAQDPRGGPSPTGDAPGGGDRVKPSRGSVSLELDLGGGRMFDVLQPEGFAFRPMDIAGPLSRICRWGGRCRRHYSVAQHSVWVAGEVMGSHSDLALHALMHDAAEAFLGDIPTPIKRRLYLDGPGRELVDFEAVESRLHAAILDRFGLRRLEPFEESLIARADRLALAVEARDLMGDPAWAGVHDMPHYPALVCADPTEAMRSWLQMFHRLECEGVGR